MRIEAEDIGKNRTKEEGIELIKKEGDQSCHQFKLWWDLFQLQSWVRKAEMSELEMWALLSNRFHLIPKGEHSTIRKENIKD